MWMQLSDLGLFQVLHKSQGRPIHLALLSHLQPQLEFPGAGEQQAAAARSGTRCLCSGESWSAHSRPPSPWKGRKLILHPAGSKAELLLFHIHQHPELFTASKGAALQTLPSSSLLPLCITAPWCSASGGVQACLSLSFCSSACGNCSLICIFLTKRLEI